MHNSKVVGGGWDDGFREGVVVGYGGCHWCVMLGVEKDGVLVFKMWFLV